MISVILPVFNRAATLPRCVRSVLAQTFADWELIAVDDGSADDSIRVVESFGDDCDFQRQHYFATIYLSTRSPAGTLK